MSTIKTRCSFSSYVQNDCLAHSDSEGERADHCTGAIVSQGITVALNDESSDSCVEVQTPSSKPPKRRGRQESPPRLLEFSKMNTCIENINLCDSNKTKTYNQVISLGSPTFTQTILLQLTKPKMKL